MFSLAARKALICGGAGALGSAVARAFAERGAVVVIADQKTDAARTAAEAIAAAQPGHALGSVAMDVTDEASVERAVGQARDQLGEIDIVVTAAGVGRRLDFERMSFADWRWMLSIHLDGTFLCIRHTLPMMLERGFGRVICFSSIASLQGTPHEVDYSAAKGGIDGLVRALAREVAARGVTVNAIAPGYFESPFNDGAPLRRLESLRASVPVGRFGDPAEIGALAVYLASDDASYLTGQIISPNGGFQYCGHDGD